MTSGGNISQPGPFPPIPEPFWHRSWRSLWRWQPACIPCGAVDMRSGRHYERRFKNLDEWEVHYLQVHCD